MASVRWIGMFHDTLPEGAIQVHSPDSMKHRHGVQWKQKANAFWGPVRPLPEVKNPAVWLQDRLSQSATLKTAENRTHFHVESQF
jgi:hypothetical protein